MAVDIVPSVFQLTLSFLSHYVNHGTPESPGDLEPEWREELGYQMKIQIRCLKKRLYMIEISNEEIAAKVNAMKHISLKAPGTACSRKDLDILEEFNNHYRTLKQGYEK